MTRVWDDFSVGGTLTTLDDRIPGDGFVLLSSLSFDERAGRLVVQRKDGARWRYWLFEFAPLHLSVSDDFSLQFEPQQAIPELSRGEDTGNVTGTLVLRRGSDGAIRMAGQVEKAYPHEHWASTVDAYSDLVVFHAALREWHIDIVCATEPSLREVDAPDTHAMLYGRAPGAIGEDARITG